MHYLNGGKIDSEKLLAELDARMQIHDVVTQFCRGVDRCDREMILSVFHPDAWDDHGSFAGTPEQFTDWVLELHLGSFVWTSHYITNELVEVNGDQAVAETYVQGLLRFERDGKLVDLSGNGRYLDRFERRDGVWKIIHRIATADWNRIDPVDELPEGELVKKLRRGTRALDDPSYAYFAPRL